MDNVDRWFISAFFVFTWLLIIACNFATAAEPTSAVIEFTSAEDLIARKDSVMAVCDTVWIKNWYGYSCSRSDFDELMRYHQWSGDSVKVISRWHYIVLDSINSIRHRRLVGVTVTRPPIYSVWEGEIDSSQTAKVSDVELRNTIIKILGIKVRRYHSDDIPGTAVVWFEWEVR